jgi:hypothetical protein
VNPSSCGIGIEHQVRKVQVLHDIPAVAACGEHLAMVSDVDTDDLNGGADHGGCGGERNLLGERLVERCDLLGEV